MDAGELASALERLPGVLAATVFPDARGGARVYLAVRTDGDRDAIRETSLALLRDHGFEADPGSVHIGAAPPPTATPTALPSLSLDSLDIHRADNLVECTVKLRGPDRTLAGTISEPDTPSGRARAAARATLQAAEGTNPDLRLGLHGVRTLDLFGFDVLMVLVETSFGRAHLELPGAALIERSIEHAAALATLRALRSWTA